MELLNMGSLKKVYLKANESDNNKVRLSMTITMSQVESRSLTLIKAKDMDNINYYKIETSTTLSNLII